MQFREIKDVYSENHTHTHSVCGDNTEFFNVTVGGAYSYHWVLNG